MLLPRAQQASCHPAVPGGFPIDFDGVTYSYPDGPAPAVRELSLHIAAGTTVAVVGESGSGKTTLVHLIGGFCFPYTGSLRVGNTEVREDTAFCVRERTALCFQGTFLFNDTIEANIRLGDTEADSESVRRAASVAGLDRVVESGRSGMQSRVGKNGSRYSGGERRRIGIARALVRDAPVLLLDEATASLDTVTAQGVIGRIRADFPESTILMMAHRISSVETFDRILVMKQGRLAADGTHAELLTTSPDYRLLYERQFAGSDPIDPSSHDA